MPSSNPPAPQSVGLKDRLGRQVGYGGNPLAVTERLIRRPFGAGNQGYSTSFGGTSVLTRTVGLYPNPDGSGVLWLLSAKGEAITAAGVGASLKCNVPGCSFGVAFMRSSAIADFDIVVDGVAYLIKGADTDAGIVNASREDHYGAVVFTDLPDGLHDVQIVTTGSGVVGQDRPVYLYGLLTEERYGNRNVTPALFTTSVTTVPAAAASIPFNQATRLELRGISRVDYYNTDVAQQTVTIKFNGAAIWSATLQPGASASWSPPGPVAQNYVPNFTHEATIAGKINTITYGPYQ